MINYTFTNFLKHQSEHSKKSDYDSLTKKLLKSLDSRTPEMITSGKVIMFNEKVPKEYKELYDKMTSIINSKFVVKEMKRLRSGCMCVTHNSGELFIFEVYGLGKKVYLINSDDFDLFIQTFNSLGLR